MALEVDDLGEPALKNIAAKIRVFRVRLSAAERPAVPLPDKPSLAVLPFQNMSGDPEQEYFADGMVEDITTALSRIPSFFVIARNSSFAYKGKSPDIRQVGRELGVRYVLEGSVRKAGTRVRITGQLIDATTGAHLWADRFEGNLTDIFQLQDQVTISVVGAIEPRVRKAEIERALRKPTENLEAYDLVLRGRWSFEAVNKERYDRVGAPLSSCHRARSELCTCTRSSCPNAMDDRGPATHRTFRSRPGRIREPCQRRCAAWTGGPGSARRCCSHHRPPWRRHG